MVHLNKNLTGENGIIGSHRRTINCATPAPFMSIRISCWRSSENRNIYLCNTCTRTNRAWADPNYRNKHEDQTDLYLKQPVVLIKSWVTVIFLSCCSIIFPGFFFCFSFPLSHFNSLLMPFVLWLFSDVRTFLSLLGSTQRSFRWEKSLKFNLKRALFKYGSVYYFMWFW